MRRHYCPIRKTARRAVHAVLLGIPLFSFGPPGAADELAAKKCARGVLIRFEGTVSPILEHYLYRKLDTARQQGADLVIIEIESPGGLMEASLNIAERLRDIDWAHPVAYVPRQALSGAAIAALGCDEIIMHPDARFGDAGPIFQGEDFLFRHAPEKIRSDLARRVRDLASAKGRPPALAEAMVDMDLLVYRVKNKDNDQEAFMSNDEIEADENPDRWEKVKPVLESRKDRFLEVSGVRAVELGLAEATAQLRDDLVRRYQLDSELLVLDFSAVDTAVFVLNLPLVTGLLFVIGLIALYVEFSAPGISVGGLVACLCFAIFFWSRFLGGTAGWLEVVLFVAAVVFLVVELFVLPGFGVAGLTGLLLLLVSLILASQDFVIPTRTHHLTTLTTTVFVILGSGAFVTLVAIGLASYLGEVPILSRLALNPPSPPGVAEADAVASKAPPASGGGETGLQVGQQGIAASPLRPAGNVIFGDRYVDVVAESAFVEKGRHVKVIQISGNRVVVRQLEDVG